MFSGVYTALITPFKNDKIDYTALEKILEDQISSGVSGVVPMGTTGESPTVTHEEHNEIIKKTVEIVNKRVQVIAGTGSNSTKEAVLLSTVAEKAGVDALLLVSPYYNKPPQRGLVDHFAEISKSVSIPTIIYNIPGRTGINFLPESLYELCNKADNVKAVKEATGNIEQMMRTIELCGDKIDLLSGDDNLLLPVLGIGGTGVVSVLSNFLPAEIIQIINLFNNGQINDARKEFYRILPLYRAMFLETNPIPIKAVMAMAGYCSPEIRMPLVKLADDKVEKIKVIFKEYGIDLC